jgi:hypothetical protein
VCVDGADALHVQYGRQLKLEFKVRPKQLIGSQSLDIALPGPTNLMIFFKPSFLSRVSFWIRVSKLLVMHGVLLVAFSSVLAHLAVILLVGVHGQAFRCRLSLNRHCFNLGLYLYFQKFSEFRNFHFGSLCLLLALEIRGINRYLWTQS